MVYYESPGIAVLWDDAAACVVLQVRGYIEGEELRRALDSVVRLTAEKRSRALVSDTHNMKAITQEDQLWMDEDWRPRMMAAGLRYNAVVMPTSAIAKMSLAAIVKRVPAGEIEFAYFSTLEEAKAWISSR